MSKSKCQKTWNELISNCNADFLQSYEWGVFQEAIGQKVIRLEDSPVQLIKYQLPFGQSYVYSPHVKVKSKKLKVKSTREKLKEVLNQIKQINKKEKTVFLRIDPLVRLDSVKAGDWQQALKKTGFKKAPNNYYFSAVSQTPYCAILDISPSQEEILKKMRYNTRRSIRLARERGVQVRQSSDLASFYNLLEQTSKRQGFSPHPKEHYYKLKEVFEDNLILLLAYRNSCHCEEGVERLTKQSRFDAGQHATGLPHDSRLARVARNDNRNVLAGAMVLFFNKQATYLHAGSLSGKQNLEAPYLVLWQAILEAKEQGCSSLDLGAVAPEDSQDHPWQSMTTFKMGFRPERITYLGAYDFINKSFWYWLYCLRKNFKF